MSFCMQGYGYILKYCGCKASNNTRNKTQYNFALFEDSTTDSNAEEESKDKELEEINNPVHLQSLSASDSEEDEEEEEEPLRQPSRRQRTRNYRTRRLSKRRKRKAMDRDLSGAATGIFRFTWEPYYYAKVGFSRPVMLTLVEDILGLALDEITYKLK